MMCLRRRYSEAGDVCVNKDGKKKKKKTHIGLYTNRL